MNLLIKLLQSEEIERLKGEYKEITGKNAPPYCIDTDAGVEDYKRKLRELVDSAKKEMN